MWQILQRLFLKLLSPPPHKMDEFNFKSAQYCINKIIELTKPVFGRFQSGCNKVIIEPRVVQFWSEIILVISNHAYDFSPNCTPLSSITIINYTHFSL